MRARRDPSRPLFALLCLGVLLAVGLPQLTSGAGAQAGGGLIGEPFLGAPAQTFLGASPQESPGEVWATTNGGALARYTDGGGWETLPRPLDTEGRTIERLGFPPGAAVGRTTPAGGVLAFAVGRDLDTEEEHALLIVRDPGGAPREAPEPPSELLGPISTFLDEGETPFLAALDQGGQARDFVVRSATGFAAQGVLSLRAGTWTRELVCVASVPGPGCALPAPAFRVLAIDASEGEAWLLGEGGEPGEGIELFRREPTGGVGGTAVWRQQPLGPAGSLGARFAQPEPLGVPLRARTRGQPLTVSSAGVWLDAQLESGGESLDATAYYDIGQGEITGTWCDLEAPAGLCTHPLESELPPGDGRSFAWPPTGPAELFGRRVVTGIGQGAILSLAGAGFERIPLAGGDAGADRGAALSAPDEGWLGADPPLRLSRSPGGSELSSWPVPLRRPLTAVAPEPGARVGALDSEALAVGDAGEVARYTPGQGWEPEFLLTGSGKRATPTLRGVAWPESGRAFAVGDGGAMWVWQRATGLWSPDPAQPPKLLRANFTGIAFDPGQPSRGYVVGKQGVLLRYGRSWVQEPLPSGVPKEANFTSIAFAGDEALATWKYPVTHTAYEGGVIVNDGSGWRVDEGAEATLEGAVPQRVAGLPDGAAAIATGTGEPQLIEREGVATPWQAAAGGRVGFPAALAAVREGDRVRALVSVVPQSERPAPQDNNFATDLEQFENQPPPGQPPLLTDPYPLPATGLLLRQTATGWRDEQRQAYPLPPAIPGRTSYDLPGRPDPLLALLVDPGTGQGWAVGGETGASVRFNGKAVQTAEVMRYGASASLPANASTTPIDAPAGQASFAIGGNAQCAGPCADLSGTGIAPDRWIRAAVETAAGIDDLRGFLYTGPGVAEGGGGFSERLGATLSPESFSREEAGYARRLGSGAGTLPTFAAPAESDLDRSGSLATFQSAFSGFGAPFGPAPPGLGVTPVSQSGPGQGYYAFASSGAGGDARVIVLDYSLPSLGEAQRCWLAGQLSSAGVAGEPAIVVGERDLAHLAPNAAQDASQVVPILVNGAFPPGCAPTGPAKGASAYFFDYPEQSRAYSLSAGGRSIPAFGSGTLGYVMPARAHENDWVGAGGFLLASVDVAARNQATNVAPVSVRLVPEIDSLALDATDGTLLRRSRPALFEALARRPQAGGECSGSDAPETCETVQPDPYVPIPGHCQGSRCSTAVFPEFTFTSSEPDIADFVQPDPASFNPRSVLLVKDKPVLDSHSGLLCAFNPGTTTVTVATGGRTYSQKVTVLAGSVQRPCGTTPLRHRVVAEASPAPAPPPAPAPAPAPALAPVLPPPPPPPAAPAPTPPPPPPAKPVPPQPPAPRPAVFLPPPIQPIALVPILPPPPAPTLPPTPPSGTSPVSATEREEEEEEAYESAHNAVAVRPHGGGPSAVLHGPVGAGGGPPNLLPALIVLAAIGAAAGIGGAAGSRRSGRRRARQIRLAHQSNTDFRRFR